MLSTGVMALFGFIFWAFAARILPPEKIGLATTIISAISLVASLSYLGLNVGLIRFLPEIERKEKTILGSLVLCSIASIILSGLFFLFVRFLYPSLLFILKDWQWVAIFILTVISAMLFSIIDSILVALRKNKLIFVKDSLWGLLKVLGLFLFASLGTLAVLISWYVPLIFLSIISLFFILKRVFWFQWSDVAPLLSYSFSNYLAGIFAMSVPLGLPLFVTHFFGLATTAYFYIGWTIATLLFSVPGSVGTTFLSEGSHNNTEASFKKTILFTYALLAVGIVLGVALSSFILNLFGEEYVNASRQLLLLLLFSSIPYAFNFLMTMKYNLEKKVSKVIGVYCGIFVLTFALSYILLPLGLVGIGLGWLIGNVVISAVLLFDIKEYKIKDSTNNTPEEIKTVKGSSNIRSYYEDEDVAKEYVEKRFTSIWGQLYHKRQVEIVNHWVKQSRPKIILEIALGPARLTKEVDISNVHESVCLENSPSMIKIAKKELNGTKWKIVRGNAFDLRLDTKFDLVYTFRFIRHFNLTDRKRLYEQVKRALKKNGLFIFEAPNYYTDRIIKKLVSKNKYLVYDKTWKKRELKMELSQNGFEVIELVPTIKNFFPVAASSKIGSMALAIFFERLPGLFGKLEWVVICKKR